MSKSKSKRLGALVVLVFGAALASTELRGAALVGTPHVEFTNSTQAVIRWTTDVSTASRVYYGQSTGKMVRQGAGALGIDHAVVLPALAPGTKWFFTVNTARLALATNSFTVPGGSSSERGPPNGQADAFAGNKASPKLDAGKAPPSSETWAHLPTLRDHFERHGGDFKARDPEEYARMAWEFRRRAKAEKLPTKVDSGGVIRIYDPKSGAFAAYSPNGATRTFFKPRNRDYFDRQPGKLLTSKESP